MYCSGAGSGSGNATGSDASINWQWTDYSYQNKEPPFIHEQSPLCGTSRVFSSEDMQGMSPTSMSSTFTSPTSPMCDPVVCEVLTDDMNYMSASTVDLPVDPQMQYDYNGNFAPGYICDNSMAPMVSCSSPACVPKNTGSSKSKSTCMKRLVQQENRLELEARLTSCTLVSARTHARSSTRETTENAPWLSKRNFHFEAAAGIELLTSLPPPPWLLSSFLAATHLGWRQSCVTTTSSPPSKPTSTLPG